MTRAGLVATWAIFFNDLLLLFSCVDIQTLTRCYDLEYLLLGDLRQLLDEPQTAQTRQSILVILDRLLLNLPRQLALACEKGYMTEVLEQCPNWHRQIEALHGANLDCISALMNRAIALCVNSLCFHRQRTQLQSASLDAIARSDS